VEDARDDDAVGLDPIADDVPASAERHEELTPSKADGLATAFGGVL